jgi:GDP-L-fucose synthase
MSVPADIIYPLAGKRVFVAGHRGMVGSALVRRLQTMDCEVVTAARNTLDLMDQAATFAWLKDVRPDIVLMAAAKVGGILANSTRPADFIYDNLAMAANVIHGAHQADIQRLLFLGSSCIYPRLAPQPINEESLLTGPLEATNEWYAIAKIAGIKLCEAYRTQYGRSYVSAMPTNLYGPGDNFDLHSSHVLPAMMRKLHEAKMSSKPTVEIWGTGTPRREFMHVDDLAAGTVFLTERYDDRIHINIGSGEDFEIRELAGFVADAIGFQGTFVYDRSKPDGTPRKLMDSTRLLSMGWRPQISLSEGIASTYEWFRRFVVT